MKIRKTELLGTGRWYIGSRAEGVSTTGGSFGDADWRNRYANPQVLLDRILRIPQHFLLTASPPYYAEFQEYKKVGRRIELVKGHVVENLMPSVKGGE